MILFLSCNHFFQGLKMQRPPQFQTSFFRMPQGTHYESPQVVQRRGSQTNFFRTQPSQCLHITVACCMVVQGVEQKHSRTVTVSGSQQLGEREEERGREGLTYAPALAKLKLEADKIRKWKTATQFELKQKVYNCPRVYTYMYYWSMVPVILPI